MRRYPAHLQPFARTFARTFERRLGTGQWTFTGRPCPAHRRFFADGLGWCQRPISTGTWTSAVENAESRSPPISRGWRPAFRRPART